MADVDRVVRWLARPRPAGEDPAMLATGFAHEMRAAGVPLDRMRFVLYDPHPLYHARSIVWSGEEARIEVHRHGVQHMPAYAQSPVRAVRDRVVPKIRRRLPDAQSPAYAGLDELAREGFTDFVCVPLLGNVITFATRAESGFSDDHLAAIETVLPAAALVVESQLRAELARVVVKTYLGQATGTRVLEGRIRRGDADKIDAVIWMSDLRDFTAASDALSDDELLSLLGDYFDTVVAALHANGAEVLKFVGDAVLAVFRIGGEVGVHEACRRAATAARSARAEAARTNEARAKRGKRTFDFGIALHVGSVLYGNIGAPDRLDFTVIGKAVNLTARIESLCRPLGKSILVSDAFAQHHPADLEPLGAQSVRGVSTPIRVWALPSVS